MNISWPTVDDHARTKLKIVTRVDEWASAMQLSRPPNEQSSRFKPQLVSIPR